MHSLDPASKIFVSSLGVIATLIVSPRSAPDGRDEHAAASRQAVAVRPRWRSIVPPRGAGELAAALESDESWQIAQRGTEVEIDLQPVTAPMLEKPASSFSFDGAVPPLRGLCTGDGWLIGFDSGEWGGSLWWFRHDGKVMQHLAQENVRALFESPRGFFAFCGLASSDGDEGSLVQIARDQAGSWTSRRIADLGADPGSIAEESPEAWLAVTTDAVLRVHATGVVERLIENHAFALSPLSIAVDGHGIVWVGMRRYLLRMTPFGRSYREDWFVKAEG